MVETNALVPELIVSDIERSLSFHSGRASCDLYERSKFRRKKTDHKVGFFRILVPRGRLELPLLSKTDFESAASTNSAIRACGAQYRELPLVGQSAFMVNFHTLG